MEWTKMDYVVIAAAICQNLNQYTYSYNIVHMLLSSGLKSGQFGTTVDKFWSLFL